MRNGAIGFLLALVLGLSIAEFLHPHGKKPASQQMEPARTELVRKIEFGRFVLHRVEISGVGPTDPFGQTPPKCAVWFDLNGMGMVFSPKSCTGIFEELFALLQHASAGDSFLCSYYGQYERVHTADGRTRERLISVAPKDCEPENIHGSRNRYDGAQQSTRGAPRPVF